MPPWQTEPLTFGLGLDRKTGPTLLDPASFRDIRNVHLRDGGAEIRNGLQLALTLAGCDSVLVVYPVRSQAIAAVIGFDSATGAVKLFSASVDLSTATLVGTCFTVGAASGYPRVLVADSNGKLVIAHDEPVYANRKDTQIWDSVAATLGNFTQDLDASTVAAATKFRGVERYLEYLFLWGYGSEAASDGDRPHLVRVTEPGLTSMKAEHFFEAGQSGEPVVSCKPAGEVLLAFKESETFRIIGSSREDFAIKPADPHFGLAGSRLAVTVGGVCYFWSLEGPRRSAGGLSEDLALPLDLKGPTPSTLYSESALAGGFCFYQPERREVVWVFERWGFAFHIPSGQWSYREYGVSLNCAGVLYPGTGVVATTLGPNFYGDITSVVLTGANDREATVTWDNLLFAGGPATPDAADKGEVWARPLSGGVGQTWQLLADNIALSGANDSQVVTLPWYGSYHEVAVRIKRNGNYNSQYSSGSPTDWPAISKDSSCLTQLTYAPSLTSQFWERTSAVAERVRWSYTHPGNKQKNVTIEIEKSPDGLAGWVASGSGPYDASTSPFDYNIVGGEGETDIWLRARIKTPDRTGAWSTAMATYCGPAAPTGQGIAGYLDGMYSVSWTPGVSIGSSEIHTGINGGAMTLNTTVAYNASPTIVNISCPATTVQAKIRHKNTALGVDDFSKFTGTASMAGDCDGLP